MTHHREFLKDDYLGGYAYSIVDSLNSASHIRNGKSDLTDITEVLAAEWLISIIR